MRLPGRQPRPARASPTPGGGGAHASHAGEPRSNRRRQGLCSKARLWRARRSLLYLLKIKNAAELSLRLGERSGDRSLGDTHYVGDLGIGEIGVVAEEDDESASWRQRLHRRPDVSIRAVRVSRKLPIQCPLAAKLVARLECHIERDPPNPGLQTPFAAESAPLVQRAREGFLNDLAGEVLAPDDAR